MKRNKAWTGFYKTVKEIRKIEQMSITERINAGYNKKTVKGLYLRAARYGKSLVIEHKWQDIWTKRYSNYIIIE
jgi:hypothetical protein